MTDKHPDAGIQAAIDVLKHELASETGYVSTRIEVLIKRLRVLPAQQPDVSGLVEALEEIGNGILKTPECYRRIARAALQSQQQPNNPFHRADMRPDGTLPEEQPDVSALVEALEPFADFGRNWVDEEGWTSSVQLERIVDWFGPSDFRGAVHALQTKQQPEPLPNIEGAHGGEKAEA